MKRALQLAAADELLRAEAMLLEAQIADALEPRRRLSDMRRGFTELADIAHRATTELDQHDLDLKLASLNVDVWYHKQLASSDRYMSKYGPVSRKSVAPTSDPGTKAARELRRLQGCK